MRVTFLGTGAAEGIPALFCNCEYCKSVRKGGLSRLVRSRAQLLIDGELSVDFPPDAFLHEAVHGADLSAVKYLLVTHSHMDHFYAHDFVLRGYKFAKDMTSPTLDIYGNAEVCDVFAECTRRELRPEAAQTLRLHPIGAFEEVRFGEYTVYALHARHSSREPLLYLIEKGGKRILHLTDTGRLPDEDYEYLARVGGKPVDLIVFDCTFLWGDPQEIARHMSLADNRVVLARLKEIGIADERTKRVITHFSHNSKPTEESLARAEREEGVIAAYDGLTLEL